MVYPLAIEKGVDPLFFWDYTLAEIYDIIEARNRMEYDEIKLKATMMQVQAYQIRDLMTPLIIEKAKEQGFKPMEIWDFYPDIFKSEKEQAKKNKKDLQVEKARTSRFEFAERYNKILSQRGGNQNDGGGTESHHISSDEQGS